MVLRKHLLQFVAIEEVAGGALLAEEKPVAALSAGGASLMKKGAEWGDACARPDHDHGGISILRKAEGGGLVNKDGDRTAGTISEEGGANAFAFPPEALVANGGDGKVHFIGKSLQAGRDGIKAR